VPRSRRIPTHRGDPVEFSFDGRPVQARAGETVAAALLAAGVTGFGRTPDGEPREPFCNMGTCFDCAVTVDGQPLVRTCLTPVRDGMRITPREVR